MTSTTSFAETAREHSTELKVGRATVRYRVRGTGPGLVLVHGTGSGSVSWDALAKRFTDRYTVVLPDLSGSDPAIDDGAPLTVEMLTAQLAAVIEDSGLGRVDVVGHSLGAVVVLSLAATRPDLVRRLVPYAVYSNVEDEYLRNTLQMLRSLAGSPADFARYAMLSAFSRQYLNRIGRDAVEKLAGSFLPTPDRVRQLDLDLRVSIHDLLRLIEAETLVIGCAHDAMLPVENARAVHAAIPGSRYAELDSGHVARLERPDELVTLIRDFLDAPA